MKALAILMLAAILLSGCTVEQRPLVVEMPLQRASPFGTFEVTLEIQPLVRPTFVDVASEIRALGLLAVGENLPLKNQAFQLVGSDLSWSPAAGGFELDAPLRDVYELRARVSSTPAVASDLPSAYLLGGGRVSGAAWYLEYDSNTEGSQLRVIPTDRFGDVQILNPSNRSQVVGEPTFLVDATSALGGQLRGTIEVRAPGNQGMQDFTLQVHGQRPGATQFENATLQNGLLRFDVMAPWADVAVVTWDGGSIEVPFAGTTQGQALVAEVPGVDFVELSTKHGPGIERTVEATAASAS